MAHNYYYTCYCYETKSYKSSWMHNIVAIGHTHTPGSATTIPKPKGTPPSTCSKFTSEIFKTKKVEPCTDYKP